MEEEGRGERRRMNELVNIPGTKPYLCIAGVDQVRKYKGSNVNMKSTITWKNKDYIHSREEVGVVVEFINDKRRELQAVDQD